MDPLVPLALMVFNRPDLTQKLINQLSKCKPRKIYVIADGPRGNHELDLCNKARKIALNPPWDCQVIPYIRSQNVGMVKQFKDGLDFVFEKNDSLIFLEDDHCISPDALLFACEMLKRYSDNNKISHVNLSNLLPSKTKEYPYSYFYSTYFSVWGFATWKRVWKTYDISMPEWSRVDQKEILDFYAQNNREKNGMKNMYDLHCNNKNPWTYDYQWEFNCMNQGGLAITPHKNLCTNIGFEREDATHNKGKNPFFNKYENLKFPLVHPKKIKVHASFDKQLGRVICPSIGTKIVNKLIDKFKIKLNRIYYTKN